MTILMLSWFAIAFLFALLAHALVPSEHAIVTDMPLAISTMCALAFGSFTSQLAGESWSGPHPAGFAGGAAGAFMGVAIGAIAGRGRAPSLR